jgi:methylaspartate mutase epsilon subunit
MEVRNKKLSEEEFFKERKEVLAQWPTGREVDLNEAVEYHRNMPPGRILPLKLLDAKEKGEVYPVTGMGKTTIEEQIELYQYVQNEGQADILGISVDSLSRFLNFEAAEKGLQESLRTGRSILNGLPVVNHGVAAMRKLIESVDLPVQMRYGGMDVRLIEEIGVAGGHTGSAAEPLYNYWNMNSKFSLETMIRTHQYVHRMVGYYEERGAPILMSCQGLYGGGAVPPSLEMGALLAGILISTEQGTKHVNLHHHATGNLAQDVASASVLRRLAREYLDKAGHSDVKTFQSTTLCLLQYPLEVGPAFAVIAINSLFAKLCGAQMNDVRTISEAVTIPTKEEIATTFRCAKVVTNLLKGQKIEINSKAVEVEAEMVELETRAILDKVIELGDGDVVVGVIRAVESGVLDNPFSTNPNVACRVMGVKDSAGAVRYLDHGNLPFTKEILEFHREKIAEREKERGQEVDYETIINDFMSISRGELTGS